MAISSVPCGAALQLRAGETFAPLQVYLGSIGAPSRHGAVTVDSAASGAIVAPTVTDPSTVVDGSIGPPGAAPSPASVSKKLSSVAGTVDTAVVLTLPS